MLRRVDEIVRCPVHCLPPVSHVVPERSGRVILERQPEIRDPGLQDGRTAMWRLETIDEEEEELGEEVEAFYMI
jgi:hypothetical protein